MTSLKLFSLGTLLLLVVGCAPNSKVTMGGVPGLLLNGKPSSTGTPEGANIPDPKLLPPEKRTKGQLRFAMPIEPNFQPSVHSNRKLAKKDSNHDPIPTAIESSMDRGRKYRINRLVR